MALPSTGSISMDQVRTELGLSGAISLNLAAVRTLAGKASGAISMSDLRGKSNSVLALARTASIYTRRVGNANGQALMGTGLLVSSVKFSDGSTGSSFNNVVFSGGGSTYRVTDLIIRNVYAAIIETTATIVSTSGKSVRVKWTGSTGVRQVPLTNAHSDYRLVATITLTEV